MMIRKQVAMFALSLAVLWLVMGAASSCAPKQQAPLVSESSIESSRLDAEEEAPPLAESDPVKSDEVTKVVTEKEEEDLSSHDFEPALDVKDGTFLSQIFEYDKLDINSLLESKKIPITRGKEHPWLDYLTVRTSQDQFDYLKFQGVKIERKYVWGDSIEKTTTSSIDKTRLFERDPYQKLKDKYKEMGYHYISRFYSDITGEGIPELFVMTSGGTGGSSYLVYQIEPDGYLFVGEMNFRGIAVLRTKTNGFNDLIHLWRLGDGEGSMSLLRFDGYEYKKQRSMWVPINEVYSEFLTKNHPDLLNEDFTTEYLGEVFHWSVRDDDKYRWK
jgi:hypothetical protein